MNKKLAQELECYPSDVASILYQYLSGDTIKHIASTMGVSTGLLYKKFKLNGIKPANKNVSKNQLEKIIDKLNKNEDIEPLAVELLLPISKIKEAYKKETYHQQGIIKYTSYFPCPSCGSNERYSIDSKCVACVSNNRKKRTKGKEWKESKTTKTGTINFKLIRCNKERTKIVRDTFLDYNCEIDADWEFQRYDSTIYYTPLDGPYKGWKCKTNWRQFLKYKGAQLTSLVHPVDFISSYCRDLGRVVDKQYLIDQISSNKKHGRLKVRFTLSEGIYAGFPMLQPWRAITDGYGPDFKSIEDKTAAIKELFRRRNRLIPNEWKYEDSQKPVPFIYTEGLFKDILCKQRVTHVLCRGSDIDWRSVVEKEKVIKRLLPLKCELYEELPKDFQGSYKLSIKCPDGHIWRPAVTNLLFNETQCGRCAAKYKNPYGGEGVKLYKKRPDLASSDSHLYFVKVQGENTEHNKVGIAVDVAKRGGSLYTHTLYERKTTRAISWCVEQVIKKRTKHHFSGYLDKHIEGWTEFRSTQLDTSKYIKEADLLIDEAELIGWEKFYDKYSEEIIVKPRGVKKRNLSQNTSDLEMVA